MTTKEVKEMLAHNERLTARVQELEAELEATRQSVQSAPAPGPSKSQLQAEKAMELLKAGPVTLAQLKAINPRYPSDPIYFIRSVLKQEVITHKGKGSEGTTYSLPDASTEEKKDTSDAPKA
jgi:cell division septum initiation protein DivIVA